MAKIRTVFMGTAEIAQPVLRALATSDAVEMIAVVSQPDRPKGRKLQLQPTAIKSTALELDLPVHQPEKCRDDAFLDELRSWKPDVIAVMAYGQILPQTLLDVPVHGCLNVHTSILPKYRGAAPIQWAIWDGEPETGVTIMKMDAGMDTGDIVVCESTPIGPEDNAQTIHDRLGQIGAGLLAKVLPRYVAGEINLTPQENSLATHARKITKDDGHLDWSRSSGQLFNQIRALTPWPGTFCHWHSDSGDARLKIHRVHPVDGPAVPAGQVIKADREGLIVSCGEGCLQIDELQKEGGKRLAARDFLSGNNLAPGAKLT